MTADSSARDPIALATSPNVVAPAMTALLLIIESLEPQRRESFSAETTPRRPSPLIYLDSEATYRVPAASPVFATKSGKSNPPRYCRSSQPDAALPPCDSSAPPGLSSLRRRGTRRSVRRCRRRLRFRRFLFQRLLWRFGVIHNNLLRSRRWRRCRRCRSQRLDLRPQTRQLIFLAGGQFLHALAEGMTRAFESSHVVNQALKLILRSECARRFHHRTKHVVQRIEVAVEFETHSQIFRRVVQLRDDFGQRRSQVALDGLHVRERLLLGR